MPTSTLAALGRAYPDAWRQADMMRADRGKDVPGWPPWCFLPMAGWYAIVSARHRMDALPLEMMADMQRLSALGAWRPTQGIYRFDDDLYDALISTPLDGDMPCQVLYRLPAWCVYVETPLMVYAGVDVRGFFAHLECDANSGAHELRLLLQSAHGDLLAVPIHLGAWPIAEGLRRMRAVAEFNFSAPNSMIDRGVQSMVDNMTTLQVCINLLLYLCSDGPDVRGPHGALYVPGHPKAKKVKTGWRLFAPLAPTVWRMGEALGDSIRAGRRAPQGGTHGRPRPHIRRAHWHGYWTGPLKGDRRFDLRWLPPVAVAMAEEDGAPEAASPPPGMEDALPAPVDATVQKKSGRDSKRR